MGGFLVGIRGRLILLALAAAVPALLAVLYSAIMQYRQATAEAEEQALRIAQFMVDRERVMIDEARSALGLLSRNSRIGRGEPERCAGLLREMYSSGILNAQTMAVVSVVKPDGTLHCSSQPELQPVDVANRVYFRSVLETRQFALGGAIVEKPNARPMVPAAYPILDAGGEIAAVLVAGLNLPELAQAVPALPAGADVLLLRGDGMVMGRRGTDRDWVGKTFRDAPLVQALAAGEGPAIIQQVGLDGVERIYAIQPLTVGLTRLYSAVGFATESIYAASYAGLANGLAAVVVAALAAAFLGRFLGHGLVFRSVQALSQAAERIAAGDFTVRVPTTGRRDELNAVGESFNAMIGALAERETALRESEQRYREVLDLIQVAVWIHVDLRIVFANSYAAQMFGAHSPAELIGRDTMSLVDPSERARVEERMRLVTQGERTVLPLVEVRLRQINGRPILAEAQAMRFVRDGKIHVLSTGRDVTAQREAEEQLRQAHKMEGIGRLTGGVAHDFNNLLTVIIGNLDAVLPQAPPPLRRAIDNALQGAERAATLTQRLLAYSRRQPLNPEPVDLNDLLSSLEDMLRRTLGEDIEIAMKLDPELWRVHVDRGQVEYSLLNVVVNARDAMPDGGKLTIETGNVHLDEGYGARNAEVSPGDYAMLAVTDTGVGMSPEVAERAIEPFFTTKQAGKGTGLGLSMVYGFAKQSRGHLKIYSEPGQGTTVRLYLPRLTVDAEVLPAPSPAAEAYPGGGETILVVEDDEAVRSLVVSQLEDLGYTVIEAADGPSAQAILRTGVAIDLLFTDVVMPGGMTGRRLEEEARRQRPALRTLFTSGYTENSIVHQGRLDPGVHLLSKPYKKRDLAHKVREVLDAPLPAAAQPSDQPVSST